MIHIDDLSGYPFSGPDLYSVCEKYAARLVKSAEAVQLDFEPTETSRTAIRQLMDKSLQKARRQMLFRRVATIAAVVVILFSTIMATNVHAREAVVRWLRQIFPDHILYQFFGEPVDELYQYTIGWIPNEFALIESEIDNESTCYIYENDNRVVIIEFNKIGTFQQTEFSGFEEYTIIDTIVNGNEAFIYQDNDSDKVNMTVFDRNKECIIEIDTNIGMELTRQIAESIY